MQNSLTNKENEHYFVFKLANELNKETYINSRFSTLATLSMFSGLFSYLPPIRFSQFQTTPNIYFFGEGIASSGKSIIIDRLQSQFQKSLNKIMNKYRDQIKLLELSAKKPVEIKQEKEKLQKKLFRAVTGNINGASLPPILNRHLNNITITITEIGEAQSFFDYGRHGSGDTDTIKKAWLGETISKHRIHQDGIEYHSKSTLAFCAAIQTMMLDHLFSDDFALTGLTSRILYAQGDQKEKVNGTYNTSFNDDILTIADVVYKWVADNQEQCSIEYFAYNMNSEDYYNFSAQAEKSIKKIEEQNLKIIRSEQRNRITELYQSTLQRQTIHIQKVAATIWFCEKILKKKQIPEFGSTIGDKYVKAAIDLVKNQYEYQFDLMREYDVMHTKDRRIKLMMDSIIKRSKAGKSTSKKIISDNTRDKSKRIEKIEVFQTILNENPHLLTRVRKREKTKHYVAKKHLDEYLDNTGERQ